MKSHPPVFGAPRGADPLDSHTFAAALKMHRKRMRITQSQCAHILGVSLRCLSQWETYHAGTHPLKMEGVIERLRNLPPVKPQTKSKYEH